MNKYTENYDILETGSVVLPPNEYLEFEIGGLKFRFSFLDEVEGSNPVQTKVTGQLIQGSGKSILSIKVINYNSLFTTPPHMLEMGTLDGKRLFVLFSVVSLSADENNKMRVFHYTWYKSKVERDGTSPSQE